MTRSNIIYTHAGTPESKQIVDLVKTSFASCDVYNTMMYTLKDINELMEGLKDGFILLNADKWDLPDLVDILERLVTTDNVFVVITLLNVETVKMLEQALPYCEFITGTTNVAAAIGDKKWIVAESRAEEQREIDLLIGEY